MQRKVLIIGEHSYIGNSFKEYVTKNHFIDSKIQVEMVGAKNGQWEKKDFSQYDVILHVAAIVHQKEKLDKKQLYIDVNTKFPILVAQKAKKAGVKQFIFLSTMAVYGNVEGAITEKTPLKPVTMYGKSKLLAERKLQELSSEQFKVAIVRPPMVYGKGCPGNYKRLEKLAKYCPVFPDVDNKRSMIHIENLCEYLYLIIEREKIGIGLPQNFFLIKTADLFCRIRTSFNKRAYRTSIFNSIIFLFIKKSNIFSKMFGDCYYQKNLYFENQIKIGIKEYQVVTYEESIYK